MFSAQTKRNKKPLQEFMGIFGAAISNVEKVAQDEFIVLSASWLQGYYLRNALWDLWIDLGTCSETP
jgi:hypothetical protein